MDEIVTPHQTTLLKLLDSYLQSTPVSSPGTQSRITKTHVKLCPMLSNLFFSLSTYAQTAMRRSLLSSDPNVVPDHSIDVQGPPAELDVLLPKVCEALVLTAQCIITITLAAHSYHLSSPTSSNSTASTHESIHAFFNQIHLEGVGLVENLVGALDIFSLSFMLLSTKPVYVRTSSSSGQISSAHQFWKTGSDLCGSHCGTNKTEGDARAIGASTNTGTR